MATSTFQPRSGNYATTVDVWVRENDGETVQRVCITVLTDDPVSPVYAEREAMEIVTAQVRDEGAWGGVFAASARPGGYLAPRPPVAS